MGALLYEMLTGFPYCYAGSKKEILNNIEHMELMFPRRFSNGVKDLIKGLMNKDSKKRLGSNGGA